MNYTRDTVLLSLLKLDPENTMKVLRMVGGLKTSGRLVSRPMPPEDAPEDSNLPRRLAGRKKFTPVSLHMQRPVILLRGSTVGAFDGETLVSPSRSIRVPGDDISALHPIRGSHVTSGVCVPMGASSAHAASNHMSYGHPPTG